MSSLPLSRPAASPSERERRKRGAVTSASKSRAFLENTKAATSGWGFRELALSSLHYLSGEAGSGVGHKSCVKKLSVVRDSALGT